MISNFTPVSALAGGALIGVAVVLTMRLLGRVAGISGILHRSVDGPGTDERTADWLWRPGFLLGLVVAGGLVAALRPGTLPAAPSGLAPAGLVVAGLLVGWGTAQARGCTSGHGVCGLARGSKRSLAATAVFMATGALAVWWLRHGLPA
ncbi:hypothetical protein RGE_25280 [Rubrivivax gelatinosus IL144]|uniref:Sulphur transport domain-containing protein n=1 Tax=Rubrivivax gelatinosus (strain NBRC 100245 / IL144) TaxID=983917 RepID=I0HS82_RUBGI|nr:hypothetical protein RGE_25280 [Rubrivivax gelatinosus IL144]